MLYVEFDYFRHRPDFGLQEIFKVRVEIIFQVGDFRR